MSDRFHSAARSHWHQHLRHSACVPHAAVLFVSTAPITPQVSRHIGGKRHSRAILDVESPAICVTVTGLVIEIDGRERLRGLLWVAQDARAPVLFPGCPLHRLWCLSLWKTDAADSDANLLLILICGCPTSAFAKGAVFLRFCRCDTGYKTSSLITTGLCPSPPVESSQAKHPLASFPREARVASKQHLRGTAS